MMRTSNQSVRPSPRPVAKTTDPQRWWQWVLVYPTLAIAVLSSAPGWIDKAKSAYLGVNQRSVAEAEAQNRLWRRNLSCAGAPFSWYSSPNNVRVDATICDSGDIFVRAVTPSNSQFFKWVPLDEVVAAKSDGGALLESPAHAGVLRAVADGPLSRPPLLMKAQYQAAVLCQRFVNSRMLLRRVQTPEGCFDETVDTYNGMVVRRVPAPCTQQC